METAKVLRAAECDRSEADWGTLTWFASAALGNSDAMTVGRCTLEPGCANPMHSHPNCAEVLVVVDGTVAHAVGRDDEVRLEAGDVITIPPNIPHNARNIGNGDAVLFIAFSAADRRTVGE